MILLACFYSMGEIESIHTNYLLIWSIAFLNILYTGRVDRPTHSVQSVTNHINESKSSRQNFFRFSILMSCKHFTRVHLSVQYFVNSTFTSYFYSYIIREHHWLQCFIIVEVKIFWQGKNKTPPCRGALAFCCALSLSIIIEK